MTNWYLPFYLFCQNLIHWLGSFHQISKIKNKTLYGKGTDSAWRDSSSFRKQYNDLFTFKSLKCEYIMTFEKKSCVGAPLPGWFSVCCEYFIRHFLRFTFTVWAVSPWISKYWLYMGGQTRFEVKYCNQRWTWTTSSTSLMDKRQEIVYSQIC